MQVFGVHQPITFYGFMNMKASIEFPITKSGDHLVEDAVEAILIEKSKRIQRLLPKVNCKTLDNLLSSSDKPTVVYFGAPSLIKGNNAKLSFLKHVQQANLMAFTQEQHNFFSVFDINCIKEKGLSGKEQDWTLVYYPASTSPSKPKLRKVHYPNTGAFGDIVHWLDTAYAEDTQTWSKHSHICLTSHAMNVLILFVSDVQVDDGNAQRTIFREAIEKVISQHNLSIIPVVYPIG